MLGIYTKELADTYIILKSTVTGVNPDNSDLVSVELLKVDNNEVGSIQTYPEPDAGEIIDKLGSDIIVGYSAGTDIRFICKKAGLEDCSNKYMDLNKQLPWLIPEVKGKRWKFEDYVKEFEITGNSLEEYYLLYELVKCIIKKQGNESEFLAGKKNSKPITLEEIKTLDYKHEVEKTSEAESEGEEPVLEPEVFEDIEDIEDIEETAPITEDIVDIEDDYQGYDVDITGFLNAQENLAEVSEETKEEVEELDPTTVEVEDIYPMKNEITSTPSESEVDSDSLKGLQPDYSETSTESTVEGFDLDEDTTGFECESLLNTLHEDFKVEKNNEWLKWLASQVYANSDNIEKALYDSGLNISGDTLTSLADYTYGKYGELNVGIDKADVAKKLYKVAQENDKPYLLYVAKGMCDKDPELNVLKESDDRIEFIKDAEDTIPKAKVEVEDKEPESEVVVLYDRKESLASQGVDMDFLAEDRANDPAYQVVKDPILEDTNNKKSNRKYKVIITLLVVLMVLLSGIGFMSYHMLNLEMEAKTSQYETVKEDLNSEINRLSQEVKQTTELKEREMVLTDNIKRAAKEKNYELVKDLVEGYYGTNKMEIPDIIRDNYITALRNVD